MYSEKFIYHTLKRVVGHVKLNDVANNAIRQCNLHASTSAKYCLRSCFLKTRDYRKYKTYEQNIHFVSPCAFLLGLFGTKEKDKDEELIMTIKRSILLIKKGEFKKAEQMLHVALRQAQTMNHYDGITYVHDVMANLAFETGEYDKAEALFVSVLQRLMSKGATENDMRVIHISLKIARLSEQKGDFQKADNGYNFCLKHLKEHLQHDPENEDVTLLWAMTLDWYARFLTSQSKYTKALEYFLEAYNLCVKLNGTEHEQTVVLLNDLGTICSLKGEDDRAIEYLTLAAEIGEKLPEMVDLGSIHVNLGNVLMKKGMFEEAKRSCNNGWKLSKDRGDAESFAEAKDCLTKIKQAMA